MQQLPFDEDRDIAALIKRHRADIDGLRDATRDVCDSTHDDIFYLRYVLSFIVGQKGGGGGAEAAEAIRFGVAWRREPANAFFLDKARRREPSAGLPMELMKKEGILVAYFHAKPALDGGPVQLVRQGIVDMGPILDFVEPEEMLRFANQQKEELFIMCDKATRETGRLVKAISIVDFHGLPMRRPPSKWMNAMGESSKLAEKLYPQLLEASPLVNTPTWFNWVFKIVRLFMSKKTLEKMKFCPADTSTGDITTCPFIRHRIGIDSVPTFLGGKCECEGGCIPGVPNKNPESMRHLTAEEIARLKTYIEKQRVEERAAMEAWLKTYKQQSGTVNANELEDVVM